MDSIEAIILYLPIVHDEYLSGKRSLVVTKKDNNENIPKIYRGYQRVAYISVNDSTVYVLHHDGSERTFVNIPFCILREPVEEKGGQNE